MQFVNKVHFLGSSATLASMRSVKAFFLSYTFLWILGKDNNIIKINRKKVLFHSGYDGMYEAFEPCKEIFSNWADSSTL